MLFFTLVSGAVLHSAETFEIVLGARGLDEDGYPANKSAATERGKADALRDVSNGVLRLPMYGLPAQWASDYFRIFKERYNVDLYVLGGCTVSEGLTAYADAYGKVSHQAIRDRFGTNVFTRVRNEAERFYKKKSNLEIPVFAKTLGTHRVKVGETMTSIAKLHRVPLQELLDVNPRVIPTQLQLNQILVLP